MNSTITVRNIHRYNVIDTFESLDDARSYYERSMPDRDWTNIKTIYELNERLPDHLYVDWHETKTY